MSAAREADFAAYVAARWPSLVRGLVLLGHPPDEADAVAIEGLARCTAGFAAARRDGDLDVWVYRAVLAARDARRPDPDPAVGVLDPTIRDPEERTRSLAQALTRLARLPAPERAAVVLTHVAELDTAQVGDVLGVDPALVVRAVAAGPSAEDLRRAGTAVPLRPEPVDAVTARVRARRVARRRLVAGVTVAGLAAAGTTAWATTRSEEPGTPPPEVRAAVNPADLPWYANGVLHLSRVTVVLPQLRQLAPVPDGVVATDDDGRVLRVDERGRVSTLGRTEPGAPIASWAERGWVAWVDTARVPELLVHDTRDGVEVARRPAEPGLRVVAVEEERVYYDLGGEPWSWRPADEEPGREPGDALLDVASGVRVASAGAGWLRVTQPQFMVEVTVRGTDPVLSPDGDHMLARVEDGLPGELRVYRSAEGSALEPHLADGEVAVAAAFGPDRTVTYVVALREHAPEGDAFVRLSESGPRLMRSCDLDTGECTSVTQFAHDRGFPVLPG